jgi:PPE-repeat protein
MVLDFAGIPPEINSGLMYAGAGSGPLMAAASSYNNLAAELSTTASSWESIITNLTTEAWTGPASVSAASAAQPYVAWLSTTAAKLEQAGAQAAASAAAYEAAFAATVPPPVVAANRATLAALVATNILGINTPAIAATEAHYAEMWVQDATAMYAYSAAATAAAALQPITPAAPTTSPTAAATQAAAVPAATVQSIGTNLWNALPSTLQDLLTSLDSAYGTPFITNFIQQVGVTAAWFVGNTIPTVASYAHTIAAAEAAAPAAAASQVTPAAGLALVPGSLVGSVGSAGGVGGLGGAVSAGLGEAGSVGGLSVPASWSAAAPATLESSAAPLAGSGWTAGVEETAGTGGIVPGMPGMAAAGKGAGALAGPRYGFKPIVMPKQVVV